MDHLCPMGFVVVAIAAVGGMVVWLGRGRLSRAEIMQSAPAKDGPNYSGGEVVPALEQAYAEAVAVKALDWEESDFNEDGEPQSRTAKCSLGEYCIEGSWFGAVPYQLQGPLGIIGEFKTVPDAKAAAQANFESLILPALLFDARVTALEPAAQTNSREPKLHHAFQGV